MADLDKLATMRTILNRLSKAVLGYPLTVKDGQLIAAQTRAKPSKETTEATEATEVTEAAETAGMIEYEIDKAYDLERFKKWFKKNSTYIYRSELIYFELIKKTFYLYN